MIAHRYETYVLTFVAEACFDAEKCTEVHFASFLSGGFITATEVNPPERKLAKCISVKWFDNYKVHFEH